MKTNGHDTSITALSGHGLSPSRAARVAPQQTGRAASDDTRDIPTAAAASSAAAGKERDACAEAAPRREGEKKSGGKKNEQPRGEKASKADAGQVDIPAGSEPLAEDGPTFVDDMHAHVDLYLACARLVKSKDEKIAQRMVERLLEMSYGKSPAPAEEQAPQIIFEAPPPISD